MLDTIEHRSELEKAILALVQVDGRRAGVDVKEIRLGESAIPPELLLARQRQQLAGQLKQAYEQEQIAQVQRQAAEQAKATAEQQPTLVKAQIGVQTADLNAKKRKAEGQGEQEYLSQVAAGQKAQAEVLGKDAALELQVVKLVLDAVQARPEIVSGLTLPQVMVMGAGGGRRPRGSRRHPRQADRVRRQGRPHRQAGRRTAGRGEADNERQGLKEGELTRILAKFARQCRRAHDELSFAQPKIHK